MLFIERIFLSFLSPTTTRSLFSTLASNPSYYSSFLAIPRYEWNLLAIFRAKFVQRFTRTHVAIEQRVEPGPEQWNEGRGTKETVSTDDGRKIGDGPRQLFAVAK